MVMASSVGAVAGTSIGRSPYEFDRAPAEVCHGAGADRGAVRERSRTYSVPPRHRRNSGEHAQAGRTNPQIAAELKLSPKTVMHHSGSVYPKLGVRGRAEAIAHAYRNGILSAQAPQSRAHA